MSRKKKKVNLEKTKSNNKIKKKKILDGIDINNKTNEVLKDNLNTPKDNNISNTSDKHNNLQNIISVFFTIIIFVALILLIYVLYENYIKDKDLKNCDVKKVCHDYIKEDYGIKEEDVLEYIVNERGILYNLYEFNREELTNNDLLEISKYHIWDSARDYALCDSSDTNCLDTKKEMNFFTLKTFLKEYLDLEDFDISFPMEWTDNDSLRIYKINNDVILTFKSMQYQTLKHDIIDIVIDEDNILITFALENSIPNTEYYSYVGFKKVKLKYKNNKFYLNYVKTSI